MRTFLVKLLPAALTAALLSSNIAFGAAGTDVPKKATVSSLAKTAETADSGKKDAAGTRATAASLEKKETEKQGTPLLNDLPAPKIQPLLRMIQKAPKKEAPPEIEEKKGKIGAATLDLSGISDLSSDEMLTGYFENALRAPGKKVLWSAKLKTDRRDMLSERNQILYDGLLPQIQKVAQGKLASTEFTVKVSAIFPQIKYGLSEDELDLSRPVFYLDSVHNIYRIDSAAVDEAVLKIQDLIGADLLKVYNALAADCPYDLYWGANSVTYSGASYAISGDFVGDRCVAEFNVDPDALIYHFDVGADYRAVPSNLYKVNTAKTSAASAAAARAKSIVSAAASKSDYDKLVYYRDQICSLTSYDFAALAAGGPDSYGSAAPWQVISVFDGNASTKVVCEGYSKAFQYLCGMTSFNGDISCASVTGVMSGGTGAGLHMWNVVHMNDGKNYLVDVTNCDAGTAGAPDKLFLRGKSSGSVKSGYVVLLGGSGLSYSYDDNTKKLYAESELTLASADYKKSSQPDPVPGFVTIGGKTYYYKNGTMMTGWQTVNGGVYYFEPSTGVMAKGEKKIGNYECYFDPASGRGLHNGWHYVGGKAFWYEKGRRQGTVYDTHGVEGYGTIRGREIYDAGTMAWYWLDSVYDGAKACSKEVWMPYIYQNEAVKTEGKWVRYDKDGHMIKGWYDLGSKRYYYDPITGAMTKGTKVIDGKTYKFDKVTGVLVKKKK